MGLKVNAIIFGIIISLWIFAGFIHADGLEVLMGEIFSALVILSIALYVDRKRRINNKYYLFGIIEVLIYIWFFTFITDPFSAHCLCIFEIFSIDIWFYEKIFVIITLTYFGYIYLKGSSRNEKYVGILIFIAMLLNYSWPNIIYFYNETFIITRFPTNISNDRNYRGYSKTKEGIFNEAIEKITIPGADLDSFIGLNSLYGKDKDYVYFLDKKIEHADIYTFQLINTDDQSTESVDIIAKGGYSHGAFFNGGYAKDKNHIYHYGKIMDGVDINSFQIVGDGYSKDKYHLYYNGKIVKTADPASFKIISDQFQQDKDNYYFEGKIWNTNVDGPVKIN